MYLYTYYDNKNVLVLQIHYIIHLKVLNTIKKRKNFVGNDKQPVEVHQYTSTSSLINIGHSNGHVKFELNCEFLHTKNARLLSYT